MSLVCVANKLMHPTPPLSARARLCCQAQVRLLRRRIDECRQAVKDLDSVRQASKYVPARACMYVHASIQPTHRR